MCLQTPIRLLAHHITRYTNSSPNDSSDTEALHPLTRCRGPSPPPPPPKRARPLNTAPYTRRLARRVPHLPPDASPTIPHRDHPSRDQFMSAVLAHGLPGLEGREAYSRRRTGLGRDYIWEDLRREYGEDPVRLRRSNAVRGPRYRWRGLERVASVGRLPSPVAVVEPATTASEGSSEGEEERGTVGLVDGSGEEVGEGDVDDARSDSVLPTKAVARGSGGRVPFEDIVETVDERAEMDGWVEECCADTRDAERVQEVVARRSPALVQLRRVWSQRAVFEHVDDVREEVSDGEGVDG
ncbi:hypothetical protein MBLNU457_1687t1 [Dothideomycetes sp. NU457]